MVRTLSQIVKEKAQIAFDALVEYTWTEIVESHESNSDTGRRSLHRRKQLAGMTAEAANGVASQTTLSGEVPCVI